MSVPRSARWLSSTLAVLLLAGPIGTAGMGAAQSPDTTARRTQILFTCPHGAAKSVLASAYFQKLAKERGLAVRVDAAGTEPDPSVSPAVVEHLAKQGYQVPIDKPRLVSSADLANADIVISLGCDTSRLAVPTGALRKWDDVPAPSQDFAGADEAIRRHVVELLEELTQRAK